MIRYYVRGPLDLEWVESTCSEVNTIMLLPERYEGWGVMWIET